MLIFQVMTTAPSKKRADFIPLGLFNQNPEFYTARACAAAAARVPGLEVYSQNLSPPASYVQRLSKYVADNNKLNHDTGVNGIYLGDLATQVAAYHSEDSATRAKSVPKPKPTEVADMVPVPLVAPGGKFASPSDAMAYFESRYGSTSESGANFFAKNYARINPVSGAVEEITPSEARRMYATAKAEAKAAANEETSPSELSTAIDERLKYSNYLPIEKIRRRSSGVAVK